MRTLLILVLLGSTVAQAQPGQTDPMPPGEQQGYYTGRPGVLQVTEEQADLLSRGEISVGRYVTGGVLSYAVGFGVGHAVQGRWYDQGWIYTAGESASMVAVIYGLTQLDYLYAPETGRSINKNRRAQNYLLAGLVGLVGFRVWEIVDAWVAPPLHNRKVRALKQQLGLAPPVYGFYVAPPHDGAAAGGVAGLALSF